MQEELLAALPIIFVSVFVIGVFIFAIKYEKKKRLQVAATYQKIADTFNLTFVPEQKGAFWSYTYPQVLGVIDDVQIRLMSYKTGGKNKTTYTNLSLTSPANLPTMKIVKKGVFQKIAKTFGAQDIIIGNDFLDEKFMFKCEDEDLFLKAVDEDIQQLLLHLHSKLRAAIVLDQYNTFVYEFVNHIDDEAKRDDFEKVLLMILKLEKNLR